MPLLSVDFGLKRCGLAICDPEGRLAVGAGRIEGLSGRSLARAVARAARERQIGSILVSLPTPSLEEDQPVVEGADRLSESLERDGFQVVRWTEAFSTAEAHTARRFYGGKSSAGRGWADEAAAVLILQNYLDRMKLGTTGVPPVD